MPFGPVLDTLLKYERLRLKQVEGLPADPKKPPEQALLEASVISVEDLLWALQKVYAVPSVLLNEEEMDAEASALIPPDMATNCCVLPLRLEGERLVLAMADPNDVVAEDYVRLATGREVVRVVAPSWEIRHAIERIYRGGTLDIVQDQLSQTPQVVDEDEEEKNAEEDEKAINSAPVVRAVNELLAEAFLQKASDIHFEPVESGLRVRFRIDGALREITELPRLVQPMVTSRLKLTSGMDISEKRRPQDGRTRIRVNDRDVDFRVSSLPTFYGEKLVLRILDNKKAQVDIEVMGMSERDLNCFLDFIRLPQGMILITGPTGSGKTSTLYAALNRIHTIDTNIVTVEDPVEFQISGVNQVQVNNRAGLTFASALRSILRQDPNVVMLGEIRDLETATIALEAAMTGHLVLSTLHTNDAPSAVSRLTHLGVPGYMVASSLLGVMAQRLVRKLCPKCRQETTISEEMKDILDRSGLRCELPVHFYKSGGCRECKGSGFTGRMGIFEILRVTEQIKAAIYAEASEQTYREVGRQQGMNTLLEDGLRKCGEGMTSVEEVLKVAPAGTEASGETTVEIPPQGEATREISPHAAHAPAGNGHGHGHSAPLSPVATSTLAPDLPELPIPPAAVEAVQDLLEKALAQRAQDLYFEAVDGGLRVRFRLDGRLRDMGTLDLSLQPFVIAHLKRLAHLDVDETRMPQDGCARLRVRQETMDVRISTLPTFQGETLVVRFAALQQAPLDLDSLGLAPADHDALVEMVSQTRGLVLVAGPTGSGRTSTLYAALGHRRSPEVNLVTVEEPIEGRLPGVHQVQVNPQAGLGWSRAVRSALLQEPDVLMLGEIRDEEIASLAFEAVMRGQLVLASIHANEAASAVSRLLHLGVPASTVASCLLGVVAQRVVRRTCARCISQTPVSQKMRQILERADLRVEIPQSSGKGVGCPACNGTGTAGRSGLFEILRFSEPLQEAVYAESPERVIRKLAHEEGMTTLLEDGLRKCADGVTSLEEVLACAPVTLLGATERGARPDGDGRAAVAPARLGTAGSASPRASTARVASILAVDDEDGLVDFVRQVLEPEGFQVLSAPNPEEGLAQAVQAHPDLVILDVGGTDKSGLEACRRLREDPATRALQIILLSRGSDPGDERAAFESGIVDFIRRPVAPVRLQARVKAALRRARGA